MVEEYVVGYAANVLERTFRLYSNLGNVKQITCETPTEFMNIVSFMETTLKKEDWIEELNL